MYVYLHIFGIFVFSKSSDVPRLSFKLPECMTAEKIEDCLISLGSPVNHHCLKFFLLVFLLQFTVNSLFSLSSHTRNYFNCLVIVKKLL